MGYMDSQMMRPTNNIKSSTRDMGKQSKPSKPTSLQIQRKDRQMCRLLFVPFPVSRAYGEK